MNNLSKILDNRFEDMVRNDGPITIGDAMEYAAHLPLQEQQHKSCECKKVYCPSNGCCCKGKMWCCSPILNFGNCLVVSCCFCIYKHVENPGVYSCTDLKGNYYAMVALGNGEFAWFTENTLVGAKGNALEVSNYCR